LSSVLNRIPRLTLGYAIEVPAGYGTLSIELVSERALLRA
jgi:hypothetical protein